MFQGKTIDSVLASAKKVVGDLRDISKREDSLSAQDQIAAHKAQASADSHAAEASKAFKLSEKWAALLEVD